MSGSVNDRSLSNEETRLLCIFLLFVAVPACLARADRVDDYAREQMRLRHIPGLALAVVREGRVVKESGYGLASVELEVPVTPSTVFEIGSISKQITAAAVMMLVEEGKVSLNDRISKYIAESPQSWRGVTVRTCSHTRRASEITAGCPASHFQKISTALSSSNVLVPIRLALRLAKPTATATSTTIFSATSSSRHRERVTALCLRTHLQAARNACDARPRPPSIIKNRAQGYEREDDQLVGRDHSLTDVFSAGAIVSTVQDLEKWEAGFVGGKLLKRSSIEQIWTPVRLNSGVTYPYGFGWYMETARPSSSTTHRADCRVHLIDRTLP